MKRKVLVGSIIVVALFALWPVAKDAAIDYYVANHYERSTSFPAGAEPDQVILTWSGDPQTTQAINWRTAPSVTAGAVEFRRADAPDAAPRRVDATYKAIEDRLLKNDPTVHRWTAEISGLEPATRYAYRVGTGAADTWGEWTEFATAPSNAVDFSFIYLGDPQKGLDEWGKLVEHSYERFPKSAFYVVAGDLVNDGNWRNEWDEFFAGSTSVFQRVPVVPCLGNHDVDDNMEAALYLESFALPASGPSTIGPERAFSFAYGNALFVVLDSNLSIDDQSAWLEEQLAQSAATWKFAIYHHPAYPSAPHRQNEDVRDLWGALFDKYHVDIALQGHDHAYMRTYPMRAGTRADSVKEGTYYVVSVSGTKFYEQVEHDYAEVAFPNVMTYQTIDIATNPDRLTYRAYDTDGNLKDEVTIEK